MNEALNGDEGDDVRQIVLNYIKIRQSCQNFRSVYRILGKQDLLSDNTKLLDNTQIPQIGKDLEERNKFLTIQSLKKQGDQYKNFNQEIIRLLDPRNADEADPSDKEASQFKKLNKKIESHLYFDQKYNVDFQINQRFGQMGNELIRKEYLRLKNQTINRKRDEKTKDKQKLKKLFVKYI
ncbi:UNKNOWN [Stylonychia lemnae]|uniref:Uncharacterized protein n=1 Tax=Stylonychia lemnae TaxID=5949 RepID=A0A078AW11_STYLE|nr:UNKNOWN [Stylonychia lemnae]|eukprot:CDW84968.1 UNKNOWN [Stylonychia lemnae]